MFPRQAAVIASRAELPGTALPLHAGPQTCVVVPPRHSGRVRDLGELVAGTWSREVRPLIEEALRCYNAGAYRAAIVACWTAVCADVMEKALYLDEEGTGSAKELAGLIRQARQADLSTGGVKAAQRIEDSLLGSAETLELVDSIGRRQLERLREDRNLCAHPSLAPVGGYFQPTSEEARQHLATVVDVLLGHPPVQGRPALERLLNYLVSSGFSGNPTLLVDTFLGSTQSSTRRHIADLVAKHALLELDAPPDVPVTADELAGRAATCARAFAAVDRELILSALKKATERLPPEDGPRLLRALGRLGDHEVFWASIDDRLRNAMAAALDAATETDLPDGVLGLASSPLARAYLPSLPERFAASSARQKATAMGAHPSPEFAPYVAGLLRDAGSYRGAEQLCANGVLPMGRYLSQEHLEEVLDAWLGNDQCLQAGAMTDNACVLFNATRHLLPGSLPAWQHFLDATWERFGERKFDYYTYPDLRQLVAAENNKAATQ